MEVKDIHSKKLCIKNVKKHLVNLKKTSTLKKFNLCSY